MIEQQRVNEVTHRIPAHELWLSQQRAELQRRWRRSLQAGAHWQVPGMPE